jgi:hypothetical protein
MSSSDAGFCDMRNKEKHGGMPLINDCLQISINKHGSKVTDKRKDLIYPSGKGSSSIVRAFDERIQVAL